MVVVLLNPGTSPRRVQDLAHVLFGNMIGPSCGDGAGHPGVADDSSASSLQLKPPDKLLLLLFQN
jgi:hypothetical protein